MPYYDIEPSQPRRTRGDTDPAFPGLIYWSTYSRKVPASDGSTRYTELWLKPEAFEKKKLAAIVNSRRDRRSLMGRAYSMMVSARARARAFGRTCEFCDEFRDHIADLIVAASAAGVCPVLSEPWSDDIDNSAFTMTLDRIGQSDHYGIGTVRIISRRANSAIYSSTNATRMLLAKRSRMGRARQLKVAKFLETNSAK